MTNPLVTIRMNSFNHGDYLEAAVMSAINQSYQNTEIIVIDDGSTDNSNEILRKLSSKYDFLYISQENKGIPATINDILKNYTNGKYVIGNASDDILLPDVIEKYVDFMEKNPEIGMCFSNAYKINAKSKKIGQIKGTNRKGWLLEDVALGKCNIPLMTLMWRVNIFDKIGYYDDNNSSEDIYMFYKVAKNYKIGYVDVFAKKYRYHESNNSNNVWEMYENSKQVLNLYENETFYKRLVRRRHLQWFCILSSTYRKEAFKYFPNAILNFYSKLFIIGIFNFIGLGFLMKMKK